jgi:hypothetical protein
VTMQNKKSFYIKTTICFLSLAIFVLFFVLIPTKPALGATYTWDNGGGDGLWSTCTNWTLDTCPGSSDTAIFDNTSVANSNVDTGFAGSVANLTIQSTYSGTITLQRNLAVSDVFTQAGGTFTSGAESLDVGLFTQSGGIFNASSDIMTIGRSGISGSETVMNVTGGTFNHNLGTVSFDSSNDCCDGGTFTIDVNNTITFNHVESNVSINFAVANIGQLKVASGDTAIVLGNLSHMDAILNGDWELRGNLIVGPSAQAGREFFITTGSIKFNGTGAQTYTHTAPGRTSKITVDKALGSVASSGSATFNVAGFTLTQGTFTAPTGVMSIGNIADNGANDTPFSIVSGTFNHNSGTVKFDGSNVCCSPGTHTIDVSSSVTLNNVEVSVNSGIIVSTLEVAAGDTVIAAGSFTHTHGILNGAWEVRGDATVASTADGGNATLAFTGSGTQVYTDNGGDEPDGDVTINKTSAGNTVALASDTQWNASGQDLTITQGTFSQGASFNLLVGAVSVGATGTWSNTGTGDITLGGDVSNAGTITLNSNASSCNDADSIVLTSSSGGSQRTWSGAGTFTLYDLDVSDMAGSMTTLGSTNTSNNTWTFNGCNASPDAPSSLAPAGYVDGSWGNDNTPTLTFSLSDPEGGDTVRFQIQIDDTSNFGSPVVDYTSALAAQGARSFTVGQAAGSGSYAVGSNGQTLADSSGYYWRVKAIDNNGGESAYSTANAGAIAFKIDTVAPTAGSLLLSNRTTTSITVEIAGASDALSGLAASPYNFSESVTAGSSGSQAGTTWTHTPLSVNTQYTYTAVVSDAAGNTATTASFARYTLANPPASLVLTANSTTQITVSWSVNGNPAGTEFFAENLTEGTDSGWITTTSWASTGLTAATSYSFEVKARNGDSAETAAISGSESTQSPAPPPPPPSSGGGSLPPQAYNPPTGPFTITINNGQAATSNRTVTLNLSAGSDVTSMALSNTADFVGSSIEPFQTVKQWRLCDRSSGAIMVDECPTGTHTVYIQFYTAWGQVSPVVSDNIILSVGTLPTETETGTDRFEPFQQNLRAGSRGSDVKQLQRFLNRQGFVLAASGPGSPGNETEFFGAFTRSALTRFQQARLGTGTGIFEQETRNLVNNIMVEQGLLAKYADDQTVYWLKNNFMRGFVTWPSLVNSGYDFSHIWGISSHLKFPIGDPIQ